MLGPIGKVARLLISFLYEEGFERFTELLEANQEV
jgi:hypothetical protein